MKVSKRIDRDIERLRELMASLGRQAPLRDPVCSSSGLELPSTHFHALMWLGFDGELPMSELARRIGVELSNCTHIMNRLERARLVKRRRDKGDRRLVLVRLAPAGARLYRRLQAAMTDRLRALMSLLTSKERGALLGTLQRIVENLNERR